MSVSVQESLLDVCDEPALGPLDDGPAVERAGIDVLCHGTILGPKLDN